VVACSVNGAPEKLPEIDESTAATLRFDGERVASFVTSFNAADTAAFTVVGTRGVLRVDPAYEYAERLAYEMKVEGKTIKKGTAKGDQFAPELLYFSDCVLRNRQPEPSGEEGMQDVRIVEALYESAEIGKVVQLPPYTEHSYPTRAQEIRRSPVPKPDLINARQPSTA
jgi:predicted dehydrogenase